MTSRAFRNALVAGAAIAAFASVARAQVVSISALPSASALGGTEPVPCVQAGVTSKCTPAQIYTYLESQPFTFTVGQSIVAPLNGGSSGTPLTGPLSSNTIVVTNNSWLTGTRGSFPQQPAASALNVQIDSGSGGGTGANGADMYAVQGFASYTSLMTDIGDRIGLVGGCLQTVSDLNGGCYGNNNWVYVSGSGVVNHAVGTENDIAVQGAAAPEYRTAFRGVGEGGFRGTITDGFLQVGASNTSANWGSLVSFSGFWGAQPISSTGDFFSQSSDLTTWTVGNIFNLPSLTVSGNILNFPNVGLSGAGVETLALQSSAPSNPQTGFMRLWNDGSTWFGKNSVGSVVGMVGVNSTAPSHQFANGVNTEGAVQYAQPAFTDISGYVAPTTFSPVDASGASLTFTGVSVRYSVVGNFVHVYGTLTYPTTASGATAAITLPVAVPNAASAVVTASLADSGGIASSVVRTMQGTSNAQFWNNTNATYLTNAALSGVQINFMLVYPQS